MTSRKTLLMLMAVLPFLLLLACGGFGKVNQGRVVAYDAEKGLLTLILDSNYADPANPRYDTLPPATVRVPEDPLEMGPAPEAGMLVRVDAASSQVLIFDPVSQSLKTVNYTLIEQKDNVYRDAPDVAGKTFPVVDRQNKTVSIYSPRQRSLIVFTVPEEYFALPDETWKAGDEVRYYYKDPAQSLRLMNVTKTDITR